MASEKAARLRGAVPILSVNELSDALVYYQRVLGFQVGWTWGDPPRLASVCRDDVELNLAQAADGNPTSSRVYVYAAGVDTYYDQVTRAGARVAVPLADRPYGMRDFRIVDPSGNELSFGEPTAGEAG